MGPVHTGDNPTYLPLISLLIHLQQHAGVGLHLHNSARDGAAHAL